MKNIESAFISYDKTVQKIGKERIKERLTAIKDVYKSFLDIQGLEDEKDFILNERVLIHLILDYFTDITRLKDFHDIERVNKDKIIAYECSWMLKRKPIQVLKNDREELVYINEKFVLMIFINHLTNNQIDSLEKNENLKPLCDTLLYYFKYRNCDAKILEMFIMMFKGGNSIDTIIYE